MYVCIKMKLKGQSKWVNVYDKSTHLISFFIIKICLRVKNRLNHCAVSFIKWPCPNHNEAGKKDNILTEYTHFIYVCVCDMNVAPKAMLHVKPNQSRINLEEYTPNLNKQLLAVPEADGMLSVSNLG